MCIDIVHIDMYFVNKEEYVSFDLILFVCQTCIFVVPYVFNTISYATIDFCDISKCIFITFFSWYHNFPRSTS